MGLHLTETIISCDEGHASCEAGGTS
jgi:hypothetical protein